MRLGSRLGVSEVVILGLSGRKGMPEEGLNALRGGVCLLIGVPCDCLTLLTAPRFGGQIQIGL